MTRSAYRLALACALSALLGVALAGPSPAHAEEAVKPDAAATQPAGSPEAATEPAQKSAENLRDPEALAELKRATDFLAALPRFKVEITAAYDVIQKDGRRLQFEKEGTISLQRPDRIFAETRLDDGRHRKLWYDGKTLSIAELSKNVHTQTKAPPTIDEMLDMLEGLLGTPLPLADLFYNDLSPLEQRAEEADIVEDSLVDGRPCTHLAFRGETVDWQMWIEQGDRPFVRKVVITYREQPGSPQYVAWLDDWQTPKRFSDAEFAFKAPKGSLWVDLVVAAPQASKEGGQP